MVTKQISWFSKGIRFGTSVGEEHQDASEAWRPLEVKFLRCLIVGG